MRKGFFLNGDEEAVRTSDKEDGRYSSFPEFFSKFVRK